MNQVAPVDILQTIKVRVNQILPKVVDEKRFLQIILEEFRKNPKLTKCSHESIVAAVVKCSREGLEPGEECYLMPRWNSKSKGFECCYQRGYIGVLTLARRTGEFSNISVGIVHENDDYELLEGTENKLVIRRAMKGRGAPLFYWASCNTKSGESDFEVISIEDAEIFRDRFASTRDKQGKIFGNWVDNFDAMAMKTVLIKLLKYKPKSYEQVNPIAEEGVFGVDGKDVYRISHDEIRELPESTTDIINGEIEEKPIKQVSTDQPPGWSPAAKAITDVIDKKQTAKGIDDYRGKDANRKKIDYLGEETELVYQYIENAYQALKGE